MAVQVADATKQGGDGGDGMGGEGRKRHRAMGTGMGMRTEGNGKGGNGTAPGHAPIGEGEIPIHLPTLSTHSMQTGRQPTSQAGLCRSSYIVSSRAFKTSTSWLLGVWEFSGPAGGEGRGPKGEVTCVYAIIL